MNEFRFDEETHTYWLGSQKLWGVTSVLDEVGLISDFCKDDQAATRGTLVHLACKMVGLGTLDPDSVDPRIAGYVESYETFLRLSELKIAAVEVQLYDPRMMYAGTFDVLFEGGLLADLKTGGAAPWHGLQTAAYQHLAQAKKRGTIYLQEDGSTAKFKAHYNSRDWLHFQACLEVCQLREEYGLTKTARRS